MSIAHGEIPRREKIYKLRVKNLKIGNEFHSSLTLKNNFGNTPDCGAPFGALTLRIQKSL
jgi:hypothetical protein